MTQFQNLLCNKRLLIWRNVFAAYIKLSEIIKHRKFVFMRKKASFPQNKYGGAMQLNFFKYMFSDSQTTSSWIEKLTQLDLCSKYVTLSNCAYPEKIPLKTDDLNVICMKKRFLAHCCAMRRIAPQCCKTSYF